MVAEVAAGVELVAEVAAGVGLVAAVAVGVVMAEVPAGVAVAEVAEPATGVGLALGPLLSMDELTRTDSHSCGGWKAA